MATAAASPTESFFFPLPPGVIAGANGSQWSTEIYWRNAGPEPVCQTSGAIPEPVCFDSAFTDQLRGQATPFWLSFDGATDQLSFSTHVRDLSRQGSWGTEIPLVRGSDFRDRYMEILNVPLEQARLNLRLYTMSESHLSLTVRLWDFDAELIGAPHLLGQQVYVPLSFGESTRHRHMSVSDLANEFPMTRAVHRIRIEIERTEGDGTFWAFVTVTNNETSHVTTFLPR